ncbi:Spx/MgsR family RNA polymerase-binding regulatory protein [Acinetobacter sichuanensis]|uniref:Spx/MgsR family RNA polymerase-binding regulatory protein n=1 Tax=Acinetobacter sichuanensis TaxID=2136183 RepID=A0A371YSX5_9GAMM|nr:MULTISPECIES: Spx/MgsR family RNA polymerase-binding regulatory protein [Acinetobacter]MDM1246217.1 Spx/MgsR family RNA polymerase-binding regulatory protein [Acinetobacter sp. R933-2]MDM1764257.1 Spx/MgsR family RNA polymerase-binding regulatory protein [Acinetobacter sp. 226-1]MDM1767846.1 Spx/MgsR family RNA polymerase-binding regulatory protein [Acinetobacter sp. 226-4]MDQ9021034.1 Spx/MgsR family RNA polymerase-binding regulatory protein [Acinetobacter sichuanensis]RFC84566.1 Spx/MgsR 
MLKIYGIKNCSSMKKAFDLLNELSIPYEFHDYKKQGIDAETLKRWLNQLGQELILNKKGTTWKKLSEQEQKEALENQDNLIQALIAHSSMIKRPVIEKDEQYVVGFDEEKIKALK